MYPLHKEKYYVDRDTFFYFMHDRHADIFKKEKRTHLINSLAMAICAIVTTVINFTSENAKGDFVWMILPIAFIFMCLTHFMRYKRADRVAYTKILKDYEQRKYENRQYSVKFYEDHMDYTLGSEAESLEYKQFKKFYESEKYFAMFFQTGELVLFTPNCNSAKIKEIVANYKEQLVAEAAAE